MDWKQWHVYDERYGVQVAGFLKRSGKLTYATVRGAGHMVPEDKPRPAFEMIQNWLLDLEWK